MEDYPFVVPIQVRWRDLDALAHVNNAAIITYVETARTELWRRRFGGGAAIPFVVWRLEADYRREITLDQTVRVGLRVSEVRGARFTFGYLVEADGEPAAEVRTVMAHVRPGDGRPSRIPDDLRSKLLALASESDAPS
jgi:acyl-CoA thioester hydrolase